MDFIPQLQIWAKGDAQQGKIMFGIGILLVLSAIFILKGENPLLKGMLIPMGLFLILNLGYGGFLAYSRPIHLQTTQKNYQENPKEVLQKEIAKAEVDNKAYSTLKPIWAVLIVISLGLFFVFSKDYYKGLALGLIGLFFGLFLIDTLLHHRLHPYLQTLQELLTSQ